MIWMKFNTTNPATENYLKSVTLPERVKDCIPNARTGFENWRRVSYSERANFLVRLSKILRERKHEFAIVTTNEMGKITRESEAEVAKCAWVFEFYAENARTWTLRAPGIC